MIIIATVKHYNKAQSGKIKQGDRIGQDYNIPASLQLEPLEAPYGRMFTTKFELEAGEIDERTGVALIKQEVELLIKAVSVFNGQIIFKGQILDSEHAKKTLTKK